MQLIFWSNIEFTEILYDITNSESAALNYELVVEKLEGHPAEHRRYSTLQAINKG